MPPTSFLSLAPKFKFSPPSQDCTRHPTWFHRPSPRFPPNLTLRTHLPKLQTWWCTPSHRLFHRPFWNGTRSRQPRFLASKSKVISRAYTQIAFIFKDMKSSSGAFPNHIRLSLVNLESLAHQVKDGDIFQRGRIIEVGRRICIRAWSGGERVTGWYVCFQVRLLFELIRKIYRYWLSIQHEHL